MNCTRSRTDDFRSPIVRDMARTSSKERARARVLTDEELRSVWKAAETMPGRSVPLCNFCCSGGATRPDGLHVPQTAIPGWRTIEDADGAAALAIASLLTINVGVRSCRVARRS